MLTVCILVKHDICLACLALTYVKLWLIPPVALCLHGKEETAVTLGFCAKAQAFDVLCLGVFKNFLFFGCLFRV